MTVIIKMNWMSIDNYKVILNLNHLKSMFVSPIKITILQKKSFSMLDYVL